MATVEQIEKDLPRTFPRSQAFARGEVGVEPLRRILYAYAAFDTDIGYVQGMNLYAAIFLTFMNEEAAFWSLMTLFQ